MKDSELSDLFATPARFDDTEAFEGRVMRGLQVKLWMRQWLVVLAGFVGGLYALAQFVRLPEWTSGGKVAYAETFHKAAVDTDNTLRVGIEFVDVARQSFGNLLNQSGQYLTFMQTPVFFWLSFSLCLAFLGLYYAYSQEETL